MSDITTIKDSLKKMFTVFSEEPLYHEESPQCKVSIGLLEVGPRSAIPLTRVEIWELADPDDEKLSMAIDEVLDHLCDDIGALPADGEPLPVRELSGGKWSGYAVNVRMR